MWLYRLLLHAFPRAFRERFGPDMTEVFADRWRAARRAGLWPTTALAARTFVDILHHAAAERRHAHRPGRPVMAAFVQDIRFAFRSSLRRPGFSAVAVLTVALGIGANTAIFSVVRPLLVDPLPYPDADRIVLVYESTKTRPTARGVVNPANFDAWERHTQVFGALAAFRMASATLTGAGDPERVRIADAGASIFDVFGRPPALGRPFSADETAAGDRVVVMSDRIWRARFGADPALVGRSIILDGEPWRVTGVMPAGFDAPFKVDVWRPFHLTSAMRATRTSWFLGVAGRLATGHTPESAQTALTATMGQLAAAFRNFNKDRGARVVTWKDNEVGDVREGLWMLQGVTLMVLLIACANLANLLLAQATGRARELSVRAALGAARGRLIRQLMTEGVLLAVAGGVAGVVLAVWLVPALARLAPTWLPRADELAVRVPDLAVALGLAIVTGAVFSALPALFASRFRGVTERAGTATAGQRLTRHALVAAQVCLALVLLTGAALLIRSFARLTSQPIGFDSSQVLTAQLSLPALKYDSQPRNRQLYSSLLEALAAEPGVTAATASTALPFTWFEWMLAFPVVGRAGAKPVDTAYRVVSPEYFRTLDVRVVRGRDLEPADVDGAPRVAVVNEQFARENAALRGGDVIGLQLSAGNGSLGGPIGTVIQNSAPPAAPPNTPPITIVGVVGDTRHRSFERPAQAEMYLPLGQWGPGTMTIAIRTSGNPMQLETRLRGILKTLDPDLPLTEVKTLDAWVGASVGERRFYMVLLSLFAALAGCLAAVGIYGVMSYVVGLRTREIGIRVALGAAPGAVQRLMVRQGLLPVVIGAAGGIFLALVGTKLLQDQLFQIGPRDVSTLALASAGLLAVSVLACWIPSRRTGKVDPIVVLRND